MKRSLGSNSTHSNMQDPLTVYSDMTLADKKDVNPRCNFVQHASVGTMLEFIFRTAVISIYFLEQLKLWLVLFYSLVQKSR